MLYLTYSVVKICVSRNYAQKQSTCII